MKATARVLLAFSLFLALTALPAAAQQKQAQDTALLRAKIEQFEKTAVNSNSSLVQIVYQRTLLALYSEYDSALRQDIGELKAMRDIVAGTAVGSQNEIALQIKKLEQEQSDIAERMQALKTGVQVAALTGTPAPRPAPRAVAQTETTRAAQQPETTYVAYAPRAERPRSMATSIPVSDTLASEASPRPVQTTQKLPRRYDKDVNGNLMSIGQKCALKKIVDMENKETERLNKGRAANDQLQTEEVPAEIKVLCPNSGIKGLLVGGVVVSQQEKNFSQADPFFGFVLGYNTDPTNFGAWTLNFRVQGIFQVQPQTAKAPVAETAASPSPTPTPNPAESFETFLASRKTFDIDMHGWIDRPFGSGKIRLGLYGGIGASTYIDKNELQGDENVTKEDTNNATSVKLDTSLGRASNDLKRYIEGGLIAHFLNSKGELYTQVQLLYGKYEALEGLYTGYDTRKRFVGRLRVFPTGLKLALTDPNDDNNMDMSPMFGVELNAGRGPDQLKFFTGVAISITRFGRPTTPETTVPATTTTTPPSDTARTSAGNTTFQ